MSTEAVSKMDKKGLVVKGLFTVVAGTSVLMGGPAALAHADDNGQAAKNLSIQVYSAVAGKSYEEAGGGSLKGSQLLTKQADGTYGIDSSQYSLLDRQGQDAFINDISDASDKAVADGKTKRTGVTTQTQTNWFKQLQNTPGVSSKILNRVLIGTQPDFVTGAEIYAPFQGPISTMMGFATILMMSLLGLTMVADIFYLTIPAFRMMVGGGNGGGGGMGGMGGGNGGGSKLSALVSSEAQNAVNAAENSGGQDGKARSALMIYFKARVVSLIFVGICIVYLISGKIWTFVSTVIDLFGRIPFLGTNS